MAASIGGKLFLRCLRGPTFTVSRQRHKKKWASSLPQVSPSRLALQYFDSSYSLQFGDLWPSIRIGLLSEHKYGALINNFSAPEAVTRGLRSLGAADFLRQRVEETGPAPGLTPDTSNLTCYTYPRGDISRFPPARSDVLGLLEYYLLDAASLLPVLALDVRPDHCVLDLCAAPGGKTLALLMKDCRFLAANDASVSRSSRLRRVLQSYVPEDLRGEERVRVTSWDGTEWPESGVYDRVLVDAPCTTDRRSLREDENNIFHRMRTKERHALPQLQTLLLLAGLRAVAPGGAVVYSTCTLSQLQNEFVVERALDVAASEYGVRAEGVSLRCFRDTFGNTFNFHADCRLGELLLPHLTANFGPMYFCKLRRVR